jgi:hypothetical protein
MENTATADPSVEAVDVAFTGTVVDTTPTASKSTTAAVGKPKPKPKPKPKVKVKKEVTAAEREVQNQKRQVQQVAQWARKAESVTATLEEERQERLTIMVTWAHAQETMKLRELVDEAKTDALAGADSSSSVTSQALRPSMVPHSGPVNAKGVSDSCSSGPRAVPAWRHAIVVVGAVVDDEQGRAIVNRPQPHFCTCGLCPRRRASALGDGCRQLPFMPAPCSAN